MKTPIPKFPRTPRRDLVAEIKAAGGSIPDRGERTGLVTRRQLESILAKAKAAGCRFNPKFATTTELERIKARTRAQKLADTNLPELQKDCNALLGRAETLEAEVKASRSRSKLISRAAAKQIQADTLSARVEATRTPDTKPKPSPDIHPDIKREAALSAAWDELMDAKEDGMLEYRQVYAKHAELFKSADIIHRSADRARNSQNQ